MKRAIGYFSGLSVAVISAVVFTLVQQYTPKVQPELTPQVNSFQPLEPSQISALLVAPTVENQQQKRRALPRSLAGLRLPLSLDMDENGALVINSKIVKLFDFYLAAMGEESINDIAQRVRLHLEQTLQPIALEQALALFENYLQYLNRLTQFKSEYEQSAASLTAIRGAQEKVYELRALYFSARVVDAFWGKSDQYEAYMLSVVLIDNDANLSSAEKTQAIKELNTGAPHWLLAQRQRATQLNNYRVSYEVLKARGAGREELVELIYDQFDQQAAQRLMDLQQQRDQWQERLTQYRGELNLLVEVENSNSGRDEQIAILRQSYFSPQEVKRIAALDSTYLSSPGI